MRRNNAAMSGQGYREIPDDSPEALAAWRQALAILREVRKEREQREQRREEHPPPTNRRGPGGRPGPAGMSIRPAATDEEARSYVTTLALPREKRQ